MKSVLFKITCAQGRDGLSHARITVRLRGSFRLPNRRNRNTIERRTVPKSSKPTSGKFVYRSELWRRTNHDVNRIVSFPTQLVFKLKKRT
jgi:hypothetical protein